MPDRQLYLITPPGPVDPAVFARQLARVLDAGDVPALLVLPESAGTQPGDLDAFVTAVRPVAQARGVAVLIDGEAALAVQLGCDGVHTCPVGPSVATCRQIVGDGAIVGYSCRNSRHRAFEAGEAGADYILFGHRAMDHHQMDETLELISWWAEAMELPAVALGPNDEESLRRLAEAGADFVVVGSAVWDHRDGPEAGLKEAISIVQSVVPSTSLPG